MSIQFWCGWNHRWPIKWATLQPKIEHWCGWNHKWTRDLWCIQSLGFSNDLTNTTLLPTSGLPTAMLAGVYMLAHIPYVLAALVQDLCTVSVYPEKFWCQHSKPLHFVGIQSSDRPKWLASCVPLKPSVPVTSPANPAVSGHTCSRGWSNPSPKCRHSRDAGNTTCGAENYLQFSPKMVVYDSTTMGI